MSDKDISSSADSATPHNTEIRSICIDQPQSSSLTQAKQYRKRQKEIHKGIKDAYQSNDAEKSKMLHVELQRLKTENIKLHQQMEHHHKSDQGQYVKSVVLGGLDGIITTFAVVAAAVGGHLSRYVILLLGIANLVADGISMGLGDYLSTKAELSFTQKEYEREMWETSNFLFGEIVEMEELYEARGMSKEHAADLVEILAQYPQIFVRTMMLEELGLLPPDDAVAPWKAGVVTALSFGVFGAVPLASYVVIPGTSPRGQFIGCIIVTCLTLLLLGVARGHLAGTVKWRSGLGMLINGVLAAGAAYAVGMIASALNPDA